MLRLTLRHTSSVPLEVEGPTPDVARSLSLARIGKSRLPGESPDSAGDFLQVAGDPSDEAFEWHGNLSGVHWIGAKMLWAACTFGFLRPAFGERDAGRRDTRGGRWGDWVGGEMHAD